MDVLALAADALWPHDEQSARALFLRAYETAKEIDNDVVREEQEDAEPEDMEDVADIITEARHDVLPKIARRDPRLAERLLKDLMREEMESKRAKEESEAKTAGAQPRGEGSQQAAARRSAWGELSREGWRRLDLARALMHDKEFERAALMSAPLVAEGPSLKLMTLLHDLRTEYAKGADELYRGLLQFTLSDASADANDILLLSSYIISPEVLIVMDAQGSVQYHSLSPHPFDLKSKPPPEVPADLRMHFYNVAAAVLARVPSSGTGTPPVEARSLFLAIGRVLPFVEREAPQLAAALHARRAALSQDIDAPRRERLDAQAELRSLTRRNPTDPLESMLEQIVRTENGGNESDNARYTAASAAAELKLWDRARKFANQIGQAALRRKALARITVAQVMGVREDFRDDDNEEPNNWERAARFVRDADVAPFVRALGLAQVVELAADKGQMRHAAEILKEAVGLAEQTSPGTMERYGTFAALTVAAARVNPDQAWELLTLTLRAANAFDERVDFYTSLYFDTGPVEGIEDSQPISVGGVPYPEDVLAAVARFDFTRARTEARTLKEPVTRAFAQIDIARAVLEKGAGGVREGTEKK